MSHMGRYTYSPTGALKWKKDVSEYSEALRGYGVPAVDEEMASLEQVGLGLRVWGGVGVCVMHVRVKCLDGCCL